MTDKKIRILQDVRQEKAEELNKLEREALQASILELLGLIESGEVVGVAFAAEHKDGDLSHHYFTINDHPAPLQTSVAILNQKMVMDLLITSEVGLMGEPEE